MTRRPLNLLTALSLLLWVSVAGLWVRSYAWSDDWVLVSPYRTCSASLRTGGITGGITVEIWSSDHRRVGQGWEWRHYGPSQGGQALLSHPKTVMNRLGFFYEYRRRRDYSGHGFAFPYWCLCLLLVSAMTPAALLGRAMKRRARRGPHLCHACAYDLRATPERCPECGTAERREEA